MYGPGHEMHKTVKKNLRTKRKTLFDKELASQNDHFDGFTFDNKTTADARRFKKDYAKRQKTYKKKLYFIFGIALLLLVVLFYSIMFS